MKDVIHAKIRMVLALGICLVMGITMVFATGCGGSKGDGLSSIAVITREEGSGTRSAFAEIVGLVDDDGVDSITQTAEVTNNSAVMLTTVAGNPAAIGYLSFGSLDDSVKALAVDGISIDRETLKGQYPIKRPFNILTKGTASNEVKDFINYILSSEGQKVVADEKYLEVSENAGAFKGGKVSGKITVGGSSSVTPLMEKLVEAYNKINPNLNIEIQMTDSSTGIQNTDNGVLDIGMASRDLKDEEKTYNLTTMKIAIDGIAVIVNQENADISSLTLDQIKNIFGGSLTEWSEIEN
ncbi:MAG: substrate-binding domain-containing protein [Clostridiales Family XIII bacterium]|jgi:phosphate transport system substrate-binding protein|nr:substrate-binding domain-containing protein [Clostridiales Family XIII bacterium]